MQCCGTVAEKPELKCLPEQEPKLLITVLAPDPYSQIFFLYLVNTCTKQKQFFLKIYKFLNCHYFKQNRQDTHGDYNVIFVEVIYHATASKIKILPGVTKST